MMRRQNSFMSVSSSSSVRRGLIDRTASILQLSRPIGPPTLLGQQYESARSLAPSVDEFFTAAPTSETNKTTTNSGMSIVRNPKKASIIPRASIKNDPISPTQTVESSSLSSSSMKKKNSSNYSSSNISCILNPVPNISILELAKNRAYDEILIYLGNDNVDVRQWLGYGDEADLVSVAKTESGCDWNTGKEKNGTKSRRKILSKKSKSLASAMDFSSSSRKIENGPMFSCDTLLHQLLTCQPPAEIIDMVIERINGYRSSNNTNKSIKDIVNTSVIRNGAITTATSAEAVAVEAELPYEPELELVLDGDGKTPLHVAVEWGCSINVIERLTASHCSIAVRIRDRTYGRYPLHWACASPSTFLSNAQKKSVTMLSRFWFSGWKRRYFAKASNSKYKNNMTILDNYNLLKTIKLLVQIYPDAIQQRDREGLTPIEIAKRHGVKDEILCFLSYDALSLSPELPLHPPLVVGIDFAPSRNSSLKTAATNDDEDAMSCVFDENEECHESVAGPVLSEIVQHEKVSQQQQPHECQQGQECRIDEQTNDCGYEENALTPKPPTPDQQMHNTEELEDLQSFCCFWNNDDGDDVSSVGTGGISQYHNYVHSNRLIPYVPDHFRYDYRDGNDNIDDNIQNSSNHGLVQDFYVDVSVKDRIDQMLSGTQSVGDERSQRVRASSISSWCDALSRGPGDIDSNFLTPGNSNSIQPLRRTFSMCDAEKAAIIPPNGKEITFDFFASSQTKESLIPINNNATTSNIGAHTLSKNLDYSQDRKWPSCCDATNIQMIDMLLRGNDMKMRDNEGNQPPSPDLKTAKNSKKKNVNEFNIREVVFVPPPVPTNSSPIRSENMTVDIFNVYLNSSPFAQVEYQTPVNDVEMSSKISDRALLVKDLKDNAIKMTSCNQQEICIAECNGKAQVSDTTKSSNEFKVIVPNDVSPKQENKLNFSKTITGSIIGSSHTQKASNIKEISP